MHHSYTVKNGWLSIPREQSEYGVEPLKRDTSLFIPAITAVEELPYQSRCRVLIWDWIVIPVKYYEMMNLIDQVMNPPNSPAPTTPINSVRRLMID